MIVYSEVEHVLNATSLFDPMEILMFILIPSNTYFDSRFSAFFAWFLKRLFTNNYLIVRQIQSLTYEIIWSILILDFPWSKRSNSMISFILFVVLKTNKIDYLLLLNSTLFCVCFYLSHFFPTAIFFSDNSRQNLYLLII